MTLSQHAEYSPDLEQPLLGCRWIVCGVGDHAVSGVDLLNDMYQPQKFIKRPTLAIKTSNVFLQEPQFLKGLWTEGAS